MCKYSQYFLINHYPSFLPLIQPIHLFDTPGNNGNPYARTLVNEILPFDDAVPRTTPILLKKDNIHIPINTIPPIANTTSPAPPKPTTAIHRTTVAQYLVIRPSKRTSVSTNIPTFAIYPITTITTTPLPESRRAVHTTRTKNVIPTMSIRWTTTKSPTSCTLTIAKIPSTTIRHALRLHRRLKASTKPLSPKTPFHALNSRRTTTRTAATTIHWPTPTTTIIKTSSSPARIT
jgi:hypothetical protein